MFQVGIKNTNQKMMLGALLALVLAVFSALPVQARSGTWERTVDGNLTIKNDKQGMSFVVPKKSTLTIEEDVVLELKGGVVREGSGYRLQEGKYVKEGDTYYPYTLYNEGKTVNKGTIILENDEEKGSFMPSLDNTGTFVNEGVIYVRGGMVGALPGGKFINNGIIIVESLPDNGYALRASYAVKDGKRVVGTFENNGVIHVSAELGTAVNCMKHAVFVNNGELVLTSRAKVEGPITGNEVIVDDDYVALPEKK